MQSDQNYFVSLQHQLLTNLYYNYGITRITKTH
jgi:hypothetical protein